MVASGLKQYIVIGAPVTSLAYLQGTLEHMVNPFAPHFSAATLRSMHWQGAWHGTGAGVVVTSGLKQ
jgi:hypothetical protein